MTVDSLLDSNYRYLGKNIFKKYDTATLKTERDDLANEVKQRKRFFYVSIIILSMIILAVSIMAYRYYQRQRSMSAELEALIRKIASEEQKADRLFRPL